MWQLIGPVLLKVADLIFSDLEKRAAWKRAIETQMVRVDSQAAEAAKLREEHARINERLREIERNPPR
jgi:hypothetical protein